MFSRAAVATMQRIVPQHAFADAKTQQLVRALGEQYLHHAMHPQPRHLISTLATPVYHHFLRAKAFELVGALCDWDRRAANYRQPMPTYQPFGGQATMPLSAACRMAQTNSNATLHVTPNAGHGQMLDNPTDYFSHLGQWLEQTDAGSPLLDN